MTTTTDSRPIAVDGTYPRYAHDCDQCRFLGQHHEADLYFCGKLRPTVIARFSDDGPDYWSGLSASYGVTPSMTEARRRAQQLGLLHYSVREATTWTRSMDEDNRAELGQVLPTCELGKLLLDFSASPTDAHAHTLRCWVRERTEQLRMEHPDTEEGELQSWARQEALNAFEALRLLQMTTLEHRDFALALYAQDEDLAEPVHA